jgi:NADH-quinone oxidoreductase subunit K|tara:strand:- start:170 stop:472 length:303 start_codon:yes stop_codon:yes gene_type:complete
MSFIAFLLIALIVFFIGILGILINRKNILLVIMSIELILLAINFMFIITSAYCDDRIGQILAIFVVTVAAAESSIGLAILAVYFRIRGTIDIEIINLLRG